MQRHRRGAADLELDAVRPGPGAQQRRVEGAGGAGGFRVALQRQHEGVAVDDAGGGRQQRRVAAQRRLHRARGLAGEDCMSSTPLASACALIDCSFSVSDGVVATISLPQLRCGTPCSRQ